MRTDSKLDDAEHELDRAHRVHPLLSRPYHVALFHLLAAADRLGMKAQAAVGQQQNAIALDMIVNAMRYAVAWITAECPRVGSSPVVKASLFQEGKDLLERGRQYMFFVAAYSLWRRGLIDMTVDGQQYSISRGLETDTRYEAYDRLVKTTIDMATYEAPDGTPFDEAIRLRLKKGHVLNAVPLDRELIGDASRAMATAHESVYQLPSDWRFTAFDLSEYRVAMDALRGVVFVWNIAASVSVGYGGAARPFWPYVVSKKQLFEAVRDVTGLNRNVLRAVFNLLEYGSSGVRHPDPALQPLLTLEPDSYVLSSMLLLGTSPERNLIVLLNQLPAERSVYAALVDQKEALLRDGLVEKLPPQIRSWTGRIPNRPDLPDVDLALLDDATQVVLLTELKWFIHPAEPREMVQRGEELRKGVQQCKDLQRAFAAEPSLLQVFGAAPNWMVAYAVASANSIGLANVQDEQVPIIRADHLLKKIVSSSSLSDVVTWLRYREYLPVKDRDFIVGSYDIDFFGWSLTWYGIGPATDDNFLPL